MSCKWKRILALGLSTALTTGLFAGCGEEKTIDYTIEGMEEAEQPQGEGGKSGLAQFEDEEVWKETWTSKVGEEEKGGQTIDILADVSVDAEIIVPQTKQMAVVEVLEQEFDAEYKETVAKNLFGSGEIYYGDVKHLPKKDLLEIQAFWEKGSTITYDYPIDAEESEQEWRDLWAALDDIENAKDTYTPVEEYTINEYIGTYEGKLYDLSFLEVPGESGFLRRIKRITWEPRDLYEVCPKEFKEKEILICSPWILGDWIENRCEISEEAALKEAKQFVDKLSLDYSVSSFTRPLLWGNAPEVISTTGAEESDAWGVNGYVFYFDLGVDDISFVQYGMEEDYSNFLRTDEKEEIQYSLQSQLQIFVTDEGVIKMVANNPVEITGVSESVELLPLDTIKGIMKEEMGEQWETFRFNTYQPMNMNGMELIFFRVRDKENPGKYSYVPTWRLATVIKDPTAHLINITNPVLINAIDGSVIDFFDAT